MQATCSSVHRSNVVDFILEMCVPKVRWRPPQRMHKKTPIFHDAHRVPIRCVCLCVLELVQEQTNVGTELPAVGTVLVGVLL